MISSMSDQEAVPRLSVITVSFNSRHLLRRLLEPLLTVPGVEIILVDNGSVDDTISYINESFPEVRVLSAGGNLGFAKAVNIGARASRAPIMLLVNPDAHITAQSVEACLQSFDEHASSGVVAPLVEHPGGRLQILEAGREPTLWRVSTHWTGLSRFARTLPRLEGHFLRSDQVTSSRQVDWVSGSCMFVSRDAWNAVDGLSERWFMYAEDTDLCLRVRDAGFTVRILTSARAEHAIGQSDSTRSGSEGSTSHAWVTNTFDLFKLRRRPSVAHAWVWRSVVAAGLWSRAIGYRRRARRATDVVESSRTDWARESNKFRGHARALLNQPVREPSHPRGRPSVAEYIRYVSLVSQSLYLRARGRWGRRSLLGDSGVTVSLTSCGGRLDMAAIAIESVGRGTCRPSRMVLWLDEQRALPAAIRRLERRGLQVRPCEDLGSHKKYFPYVDEDLDAFPETPLVIMDDDSMLSRTWLKDLVELHQTRPRDVLCHRAWTVGVSNDRIDPYVDWKECVSTEASPRNFATGVGGVLYPPSLLCLVRDKGREFLSKAPKADDVWLHSIAVENHYKTRQVRAQALPVRSIPGTEPSSLALHNVELGHNDRQIEACYTPAHIAILTANSARGRRKGSA